MNVIIQFQLKPRFLMMSKLIISGKQLHQKLVTLSIIFQSDLNRNKVTDLENADLLTPNRLRLGRNNDRSPVGSLHVTNNPSKFIKENKLIFETWFETWLTSYVPTLMYHPKWFKNDRNLMIGDIVLFLKHDKNLSSI